MQFDAEFPCKVMNFPIKCVMACWRKSFVISKAVNVAFDIEYFQMPSLHPASKIRKICELKQHQELVLMLVVINSSAVPFVGAI